MMMQRWPNQEEAYQFAMHHPVCMLDMDMGTGKTRVVIDVLLSREDVHTVLVLCPKAVMDVWPKELKKHAPEAHVDVLCLNGKQATTEKAELLNAYMTSPSTYKRLVVINYDSVWRGWLGEIVRKSKFDMVIMDESHRIKAAGSKISRYAAMIGKTAKYKLCLSGTPMANSPLDVYGQYRFLDPLIYGTRYDTFVGEYAIMSTTSPPFVVGYKNQQRLNDKFQSIAYSCKMASIRDQLKLPEVLPPNVVSVQLPAKDKQLLKELGKEFIASCGNGSIVAGNVLVKILRMQQITSGYCNVQSDPGDFTGSLIELNTSKEDALTDLLMDLPGIERIVIFYVFVHDLYSIKKACDRAADKIDRDLCRSMFMMNGQINELEKWKSCSNGVLAVQIQSGAEGVDMSCSHLCVYYSLPHSLAMFNQSQARLYRPGQHNRVLFNYLIAEHTIDEVMFQSLIDKRDLIDGIRTGEIDFGYIK